MVKKGKKLTLEHRNKLREARLKWHKNNLHPMLGLKRPDLIERNKRGLPKESYVKMVRTRRERGNYKHTEETKKKISEISKVNMADEVIRKKISDALSGDKHYNWKGGRIKTKEGYIFLWCPGHPLASKNNYVAKHINIMLDHLGKECKKDKVVHHINGNKEDNSLENLKLMTPSEHSTLHNKINRERNKR